jgi:hypothetical protein
MLEGRAISFEEYRFLAGLCAPAAEGAFAGHEVQPDMTLVVEKQDTLRAGFHTGGTTRTGGYD